MVIQLSVMNLTIKTITMTIKTVKQIDVNEWDKLVSQTYGKPYSFQQQDGCKSRGIEWITTNSDEGDDYENDSIPEVVNGEDMGVSFKVWLERDPNQPLNPTEEELKNCGYYWGKTKEDMSMWKNDKSHINMFWERNFYPNPNMIAADLCKKGLLESGEYQIYIDW
jgi:hypothetical protein